MAEGLRDGEYGVGKGADFRHAEDNRQCQLSGRRRPAGDDCKEEQTVHCRRRVGRVVEVEADFTHGRDGWMRVEQLAHSGGEMVGERPVLGRRGVFGAGGVSAGRIFFAAQAHAHGASG